MEYQQENYNKELLIIDLKKANQYALYVLLPSLIIFGIPFYLLWSETIFPQFINYYSSIINYVLGLLVLILGIVLHELIHGITWSLFAKNGFKSIKFGILWKMVTPYCHCKEPLQVKAYRLGAIMPAIILGFIPLIVSLFTGHLGLFLFGLVFTLSAIGDFMILHLIRNEKPSDWVQDHPTEAGCYIFREK